LLLSLRNSSPPAKKTVVSISRKLLRTGVVNHEEIGKFIYILPLIVLQRL
jgi:hypothetical protein